MKVSLQEPRSAIRGLIRWPGSSGNDASQDAIVKKAILQDVKSHGDGALEKIYRKIWSGKAHYV